MEYNQATAGGLGRVAVVGVGAVGGYFGGCLLNMGADVHFLLRSDYENVARDGMVIERQHGPTIHLSRVQCYRTTTEIGRCDWVLVAVKTTQNALLPELLAPLISEGTHVMSLQNGLGNVEFLQAHTDAARIVGGVVSMGINRVAPGRIENYSKSGGALVLGEALGNITGRTQMLCDCFNQAGINCRTVACLHEAIWQKLVWNVPFNGLSITAGGITTDQIVSDPALAEHAFELMKEIQKAARALEYKIDDAFLERQMQITRQLGPYKPSSLIDYLAGREVEVEALWGEPLRQGTRAGVPMPRLKQLYADLRNLGRGAA